MACRSSRRDRLLGIRSCVAREKAGAHKRCWRGLQRPLLRHQRPARVLYGQVCAALHGSPQRTSSRSCRLHRGSLAVWRAAMSDLLARLIEKIEGRFYGKYRAVVVDNADPENRGRLRLRIPSVLGADVVSGWALPCLPFGGSSDQGFFFVPEIDATVWVEFETGNLDYPIWVGTFWGKPGGATEVPKPAD